MSTSSQSRSEKKIGNFYDFLDYAFCAVGIDDFTEGMYLGNPNLSYQEAQRHQHDYLLDEVKCEPGTRILDIGCGHGTLLARAKERGAIGVGLTLSPSQWAHCRERGLDVHLRNYRDVYREWNGRFDAIIANGSWEHFVQQQDAKEGTVDHIHHETFGMIHDMLDPASPSRRVATTIIHLAESMQPAKLLKHPLRYPWGSPESHITWVYELLGGFYPTKGQLQKCAQPFFTLIQEVDGTEDYRLTSDEWLHRIRRASITIEPGLRVWVTKILPFCLRHPYHGPLSILAWFWLAAWNKQFRPVVHASGQIDPPPTTLLRQTWEYQTIK